MLHSLEGSSYRLTCASCLPLADAPPCPLMDIDKAFEKVGVARCIWLQSSGSRAALQLGSLTASVRLKGVQAASWHCFLSAPLAAPPPAVLQHCFQHHRRGLGPIQGVGCVQRVVS